MRPWMNRIVLTALGLCLLLTSSGCGFSFSPEGLYCLPQLPAEYTELNSCINQVIEEGAEYAAPVSGSNIQPVQLEDLNGDGEEEAIAFFRNSADERPLKIYIFTARGQTYEQSAVIEGTGTSIYSVAYEDLNQDGWRELLVGWRVNTDMQALSIYTLRSGKPEELVSGVSYVKYALNDLNQDNLWELVVFRADEEGNGIADCYSWEGDEFRPRSSARITSTMAELSQQGRVKSGVLADGQPALFVTGVEESAWMATDILTDRDGELTNILLSDVTGVSSEVAPFCALSGGHQRRRRHRGAPPGLRCRTGPGGVGCGLSDRLVRLCRERHRERGAEHLPRRGGRLVFPAAGQLDRPGHGRPVRQCG